MDISLQNLTLNDLTGLHFGRLIVIKKSSDTSRKTRWDCKCECGNEVSVLGASLKSNNTRSCGCIKREMLIKRNFVHGLQHQEDGRTRRVYCIWARLKQRCRDPKVKEYKYYGGRGISISPEWNAFKTFYEWAMSHGYADNLTIDRIDNDGNYESSNCRWSTRIEQSRNKRNNHLITYMGQTKTLAEWSEDFGMESSTLRQRFNHGWNLERAMTEPINDRGQQRASL